MVPLALIAALWALAGGTLTWALIEQRRTQEVRSRLQRLQIISVDGESRREQRAISAVHSLGARIDRRLPGLAERGRRTASAAGISDVSGETLVSWQALATLVGLVIGILLMTSVETVGVVFPFICPAVG